jgi:hypothetical protein
MKALPLELVTDILRCSSKADLAILCRVNLALYDIATRLLYSVLSEKNLSRALRALRTLQDRPQLARHVRVFNLPGGTLLLNATLLLLARCLSKMENLVSVSLDVMAEKHGHALLQGCTFTPRRFASSLLYDNSLKEFLETRGQRIEHLSLLALRGAAPVPPSGKSLPRLTTLVGPPDLVTALAPNRPLSRVAIIATIDPDHHVVVEPLRALARSSATVSVVLIATTSTRIPFFIDTVTEYLPRCRSLSLRLFWAATSSVEVNE